MITEFQELDLNKTYSYADYLSWRFKERVELIKGRIFKMSPAPNLYHQRVSGRLHVIFFQQFKGKKCEVFTAPFDVRLPKKQPSTDGKIHDVVQPDIVVICDPSKLDRKGCLGAPDLIVEILSPSSSKTDAKDKFQLYEEAGVREYWIIHPEEQTLLVYTLNNKNKYTGSRLLTIADEVKVSIFKNFVLELSNIFDERFDD